MGASLLFKVNHTGEISNAKASDRSEIGKKGVIGDQ
jgi:hypothetical protein